jgi:hypothetical protein
MLYELFLMDSKTFFESFSRQVLVQIISNIDQGEKEEN